MKITDILLPTILRSAAGKTLRTAAASALLVCCLSMASCMQGDDYVPDTETYKVELSLNIPGSEDDQSDIYKDTRHGTPTPGTPAESEITTLAVFAFQGSTLEASKFITISGGVSSDPAWNPSTKKLQLIVTPGTKTIYMIANWASTPSAQMPDITGITTEAALTALIRYYNSQLVNPPVMTAKKSFSIAGGEQNLTISLQRQIARVGVNVRINDYLSDLNASVTIEGVKVVGMAQQAYVFPRTPQVNPSTSVWDQSAYTGSGSSLMTTSYHDYQTFYIPEYVGSAATHTRMIIKAKYNGQDTYYGIPINAETGASPAQYRVERNHSYRYFVTIQGFGDTSEAQARTRAQDAFYGSPNIVYELETE